MRIGKMNGLNSGQVEKFHKDGFIIVKNIFSEKECAHLKKTLFEEIKKGEDALQKSPDEPKDSINFKSKVADVPRRLNFGMFQDIAHRNSEFMSLAKDKRLVNILSKIYGKDVKAFNLYLSCSIFKNPKITGATQWHQDMPYWKGTPDKTIAWIPLDRATKENGCLKYIPSTHHGKYKHTNGDGQVVGIYREGFISSDQIDESKKISAELEIGDVVFHNCRIVHASEENTQAKERYALMFTYQPGSDTSHHRDGPAELIPKDTRN